MPDIEILESIRSAFDQAWGQLQWWASVSFGLIALTHFAAKKLNLVIVVSVSFIYLLFTVYVSLNIESFMRMVTGFLQDLQDLQDTGQVGAASREFLAFVVRYRWLNGIIYRLCVAATCIGTISYLIHSYRKNSKRRGDQASTDAA